MGHVRAVQVRKWERRQRRSWRVRATVYGTQERPRLSVYRSNKHFHAQIIDDRDGKTVAAASSLQKDLREKCKSGGNKAAAEAVGQKLAEIAKEKGISKVVFDRNFFGFQGRVRMFAEAAAKGGLDFIKNPKKKDKPPKKKKKKGAASKPLKAEKSKKSKKQKKKG